MMLVAPLVTTVIAPVAELTVATAGFELDHVTFLLCAVDGATTAYGTVACTPNVVNVTSFGLTVRPETGTLTSTLQVASFPLITAVAVMVVVPLVSVVTTPLSSTVATALFSLSQVIGVV
jgi:hypothetical protein